MEVWKLKMFRWVQKSRKMVAGIIFDGFFLMDCFTG
jgi:hypothetical protein